MRGTVLGENSKKISKRIAAANNTFSEVNIHRLVQSELAHVTEEATFKSYADTGVEEYTYMATLESHTCPICGDLDLQRFKLSDKKSGVNYPTIHPYCRCTTAAWNEDMPPIGKRWSKNPETGKRKMVDAVSFNEWAKQNGLRKSPTKPKSLVNANTAEKLGAKTAADIDATLRNAPKNMQHLWSKFANQMVIDDDADNPTLGSHYNNRTGKVTLRPKDIEGANGRNRLDAYFHEMAHLIDNKAGNVSVNEDFKNALNSDYDNFMNPRINRFRNDVTKDSDKLVTYGRKSYYDTLEVKFGKNGKLTPSSARMLTQNEVRDELRTKYSKSSLGDVSDMTGASSGIEGGLFGTGHKKNYYWTPGNQEKEAFAEMTSATINNPESLELIKKIYPTAYKKYQQIVDQVNHNSKSGAVSGALNDDNDPFLEKRSKYADDTYEMLRKAKRESLVEVSAQRSGISVEAAQRGLQHILDSKYDLWDNGRLVHFDPSYDMSESLIRLRMHNG
ncbi:minor capsid protein [Lacticaseibacillus sharpeae]|nr:minor capsid protein [Lacticaseibacillus sharpeae]